MQKPKPELKLEKLLGNIADFALQEDPFCTKSKILAKGGVARRAKPEVRQCESRTEWKKCTSTFEMKLLGLNREKNQRGEIP